MTAAAPGLDLSDPDGGSDPDDPFDVRIAVDATGSLREFNAAGVLNAADVHVAQRLGRLGGESNDDVRLAMALTVRGVRSGSVCVDLQQLRQQWTALESALPWPDPAGWAG